MLKKGKVTVIGAGFVGATSAFALMNSSVVKEIVVIDVNHEKAEGEVMDLNHGGPFLKPTTVIAGDYEDAKYSEIVVITAGANQKPNETRLDLLKKNTAIFNEIISKLRPHISDETILLVVTNPVDIMTYLTYRLSGFPANKVIGSGTVLDTARLRYIISREANIDARNVHAYIIGEHGDSELAAWSVANIGSLKIDDYCQKFNLQLDKEQICNEVRNSAYEIIEKKGATYFAIAMAVKRITECILRNERSILTVSGLINNKYGLSDVCISVPCIVGSEGICSVVETELSDVEKEKLKASANTLKSHIEEIL